MIHSRLCSTYTAGITFHSHNDMDDTLRIRNCPADMRATPATLIGVSGRPITAEAVSSDNETFPSGEKRSDRGVAQRMQTKSAVAPVVTSFGIVTSKVHLPGAAKRMTTYRRSALMCVKCGTSKSSECAIIYATVVQATAGVCQRPRQLRILCGRGFYGAFCPNAADNRAPAAWTAFAFVWSA